MPKAPTKPTSTKRAPTAPPFKERVAGYLRDEQKLLKKYEIDRDLIILFPKKAPMLGKFGAWLVWRCKGYLDIRFRDQIREQFTKKKSRGNS